MENTRQQDEEKIKGLLLLLKETKTSERITIQKDLINELKKYQQIYGYKFNWRYKG